MAFKIFLSFVITVVYFEICFKQVSSILNKNIPFEYTDAYIINPGQKRFGKFSGNDFIKNGKQPNEFQEDIQRNEYMNTDENHNYNNDTDTDTYYEEMVQNLNIRNDKSNEKIHNLPIDDIIYAGYFNKIQKNNVKHMGNENLLDIKNLFDKFFLHNKQVKLSSPKQKFLDKSVLEPDVQMKTGNYTKINENNSMKENGARIVDDSGVEIFSPTYEEVIESNVPVRKTEGYLKYRKLSKNEAKKHNVVIKDENSSIKNLHNPDEENQREKIALKNSELCLDLAGDNWNEYIAIIIKMIKGLKHSLNNNKDSSNIENLYVPDDDYQTEVEENENVKDGKFSRSQMWYDSDDYDLNDNTTTVDYVAFKKGKDEIFPGSDAWFNLEEYFFGKDTTVDVINYENSSNVENKYGPNEEYQNEAETTENVKDENSSNNDLWFNSDEDDFNENRTTEGYVDGENFLNIKNLYGPGEEYQNEDKRLKNVKDSSNFWNKFHNGDWIKNVTFVDDVTVEKIFSHEVEDDTENEEDDTNADEEDDTENEEDNTENEEDNTENEEDNTYADEEDDTENEEDDAENEEDDTYADEEDDTEKPVSEDVLSVIIPIFEELHDSLGKNEGSEKFEAKIVMTETESSDERPIRTSGDVDQSSLFRSKKR